MRVSVNKRLKEKAREEKQLEKAQRRRERQQERDSRATLPPGVDPDIAGIVPGPQQPEGSEPTSGVPAEDSTDG